MGTPGQGVVPVGLPAPLRGLEREGILPYSALPAFGSREVSHLANEMFVLRQVLVDQVSLRRPKHTVKEGRWVVLESSQLEFCLSP